MADDDLGTFEGWTDDTFWNGWLNVEVAAETHSVILGRIASSYGNERLAKDGIHHPTEDAEASYVVGLWEALSGLEQLVPNERGHYSYANCYWPREVAELRSKG